MLIWISVISSKMSSAAAETASKSETSKLDISVEPSFDYMFKIILVGDSGVGKTAFLSRYCDNTFITNPISTVGIDFRVVNLVRRNKNIKVQLWDTAGQERYHSMTSSYYRGANGFILLFDITQERSFRNCSFWLNHIAQNGPEDASLVLVGNKSDLDKQREVSEEMAKQMADSNRLKYFECSTKDGHNIKEIFDYVLDLIIEDMGISYVDSGTFHSTGNKKRCRC